ncbi:hypothetical protein ACP70R_003962 [Stipagrostis hirtigluma subsp. patula]
MFAGGGRGLADVTGSKELEDAQSHATKERPLTEEPHAAGVDGSEEDEEDSIAIVEAMVSTATPQRFSEDSSPPTIYVVPRDLAEGRKDSYEPEVVCIGPMFGRGDREKEARYRLEQYKQCCARKLIVNAAAVAAAAPAGAWIPDVHAPLFRRCFDEVKGLEQQILASYGHATAGRGDDLALTMLLDGCFVLHRLLKYARLARRSSSNGRREKAEEEDDDWTQVYGRCGIWGIVTRDMLLLKNQIPFFLLRALFKHLRGRADSESDGVLVEGGLHLFASLRPCPRPGSSSAIAAGDVHHLLHLFYLSIDISPPPAAAELQAWVPCAKELEEAGVSFRAASKQQGRSFLDVSFRGGVLEIPPLELYDYSEALFRNLVAFEQTYLLTPGHVTAYAVFMDCLVKTREDVRLLHHSGVLVSHMNGERDVAKDFFSRVCAQAHIFPDRNHLAGVMADVVRYQSGKWPQWRAALVRDYFGNPWVTISFVAAFFLLVMTVLQTFFAVYGYFKPRGNN